MSFNVMIYADNKYYLLTYHKDSNKTDKPYIFTEILDETNKLQNILLTII